MKEYFDGKFKVIVKTSIKKYKEIDGYTFNSYSVGSALTHIAYKLKGKTTRNNLVKAYRKGKIKLL